MSAEISGYEGAYEALCKPVRTRMVAGKELPYLMPDEIQIGLVLKFLTSSLQDQVFSERKGVVFTPAELQASCIDLLGQTQNEMIPKARRSAILAQMFAEPSGTVYLCNLIKGCFPGCPCPTTLLSEVRIEMFNLIMSDLQGMIEQPDVS